MVDRALPDFARLSFFTPPKPGEAKEEGEGEGDEGAEGGGKEENEEESEEKKEAGPPKVLLEDGSLDLPLRADGGPCVVNMEFDQERTCDLLAQLRDGSFNMLEEAYKKSMKFL